MALSEIVTLLVGGVAYTAWKSINIKYDAKSPERTFEVVAADEAPDLISAAWIFMPGTEVTVLATGIPVITGYINDLGIEIDHDKHELRVAGRGKGQDCVDCSVDHDTHEFRKKTLDKIGNEVSKNVKFVAKAPLRPLEVVRANPGETVFRFMERHARNENCYLYEKGDGTVEITQHGKERHAGAIIEGVNLKIGRATFSDRQRHEKVKAKGQRHKGKGKKNTQIKEEVTDPGARSGRVLRLMPHSDLDKGRARTWAQQAVDQRSGYGTKLSATIPGWRDEGGMIWEAGHLVFCQSIMLHLAQDLCIESVELHQDSSGGTTSHVVLVEPEALGGKGGGKGPWSKGFGRASK